MRESRRYYPWAREIIHANPSTARPSQRGSIACDADWWWALWGGSRALPKPGPAWDESKSRSRRQRSEGLSLFALKFAGVFFEATSKPGHSFVVGLKVAISRPLQDKAQSLQPIARLAGLEFDVALFAQELHYHRPIPATSLQTEILGRLLQRLLQLALSQPIQPRWPARSGHIVNAVKPLTVGLANPVHHRLSTQTEELTDRRRLPSRQKQKQPRDANPDPRTGNRVCHPKQRLRSQVSVRNFQRFHA
jgi:hypothetical protein